MVAAEEPALSPTWSLHFERHKGLDGYFNQNSKPGFSILNAYITT
jgi:hypothetical protein